MTDYTSNEFVAFYFHDQSSSEDRLQRAREQIEQHTPYRVCDSWLSPQRKIGVLNLVARPPDPPGPLFSRLKSDWLAAVPRTNRLRVRRRLAILQTGYSTTADRRFERSIRETGEGLSSDDAGGIAAFCAVFFGENRDERLFLWSTRPGLRSIASAESPEAVVVGTRPRLVHALTRDFRSPSLDHGYLRASLTGWSLADHTPYEGTTLVSVDALLRVAAGKRTQHVHPTLPHQREPRIFRRQRVLYEDALREAVEPLRSLRGFELRLSGGKDSRLLAASLYDRGITPSTTICHGPASSPEGDVAQAVAASLGWELKRAQPTFAYLGGLFETTRHNLSLSDGFFATEPRHLAFPVHSLVDDVGPGLVMGHIELQKGGWAHNLSEPRDRLLERCRDRLTRLREACAPELTEAVGRQLDEYVAGLSVSENADYGYWINYRFRVCRWLTSHYLSHSKEHLPVYPLVDEKVTRVVSNAPLGHLVSERLLAETTWKLAPALRDIAPFGSAYRFIERRERAARNKAASLQASAPPPPIASVSAPAVDPAVGSNTALSANGDRFIDEARAREACAHIRNGKVREELRSLTQQPVWEVIEDPTHERMYASGIPGVRLNEYLWTCYQASVLSTDGIDSW